MPDSVADRLGRLEARIEIDRVLWQYAHAIDYGDVDAWIDCFTADAVWEVDHKVNDTTMTWTGHDELAAYARSHSHAPDLYHKHVVSQPLVDVDGDTATSRCYFMVVVAEPPAQLPHLVIFGRYVDRLRRDADGRWRISKRIAEPEAWNPLWPALRGSALTDILLPRVAEEGST
jgi:3-phenylpropionate/cinnamic acid dioxygenase small subunit